MRGQDENDIYNVEGLNSQEELHVLAQVFAKISGNYANKFSDDESRLKFYALFVAGTSKLHEAVCAIEAGNLSTATSNDASFNEESPSDLDVTTQQEPAVYSGALFTTGSRGQGVGQHANCQSETSDSDSESGAQFTAFFQ